jgi:very-short-patch-repair endonuclease
MCVNGITFATASNIKNKKIVANYKPNLKKIAQSNRDKLANNPTKAEVKMRAILHQLKIPFTFQQIIWTKSSFFIADFVATNRQGKKYVLELDGGYHFNYKQKKKDSNRSSAIRLKGSYGVLRFKNNTVLNDPKKAVQKLKRYNFL